jgi:hypothetical protein
MLYVFPLDHDVEYCRRKTLKRRASDGNYTRTSTTEVGGVYNNAYRNDAYGRCSLCGIAPL